MARRAKSEDWRKQRRNRDGSVYEYKGKIYARLQFTGDDGQRKDKKVLARNRKHARELLKKMNDDLRDGGQPALDANKMTFRSLAEAYERGKLIPAVVVDGKKVAGLRSFASAKRFLVPLLAAFGRKHVRTIKHSDIETYKLARLRTPVTCGTDAKGKLVFRQRSIAGVNRELELLRAMFRYAEHNEWITKSPFKKGDALISKTSERQRERTLSFDEEDRLLAACSGRRAHLRPLLLAAMDTGMRRGELFKLTWPDVDFALNLIRVRATNTKTERARTVGITPRVREALLALREAAPPDYVGVVFGIKDTVKHAFASALRDAGMQDFRFHDLRHTAISRMIRAGVPAAETMKISGHQQHVTFARYVNVTDETALKGAELLAQHLAMRNSATVEVSGAVN